MQRRIAAPRRAARAKTSSVKHVYLFEEVRLAERAAGSWDGVRALLGGKGANLAEMTRLGLPVPPGFIVTTEGLQRLPAAGGKFPPGMWEQVLDARSRELERADRQDASAIRRTRCSSRAARARSSRCPG